MLCGPSPHHQITFKHRLPGVSVNKASLNEMSKNNGRIFQRLRGYLLGAGQGPNLSLECAECGQPRLTVLILYFYWAELSREEFQGNAVSSFATTGSRARLWAQALAWNHLGSVKTDPCLATTPD